MKKYDIQPKIFLQAIAAMPGGNIPTEERLQRLLPHIGAKRLCGDDRRNHHITNRGAVAHPEATTHDEDVEHIIFIGKFAESATAPRLMPSRYISLSPCSRLHYVCRQHEVTKTATAHAVVHALSPKDVNT